MTSCHFCGSTYELGTNAPHWVTDASEAHGGHWLRVDVCFAPECRALLASPPRAPRKARAKATVLVDGGGWAAWGMLQARGRKAEGARAARG